MPRSRVLVSPGGELYTCLVPVFCGWCPGDAPWLPHSDGWWDLCSWSHRTAATGATVLGRPLPPWHCTDCRLRPTPESFCEGGYFPCLGASDWGACFRFGIYLVAYRAIFEERRLVDTISALSFCFILACWYLSERSLCTHLEPWFLQLPPRGHL